jgi:Phage ABA sandwich domain
MNRDLDAQIATQVMGWAREAGGWRDSEGVLRISLHATDGPFSPRTSIADVWMVVERLSSAHIEIIHWADSDMWQCDIGDGEFTNSYQQLQDDWCDTAPEAICKAALEAVK